MDEITSGSILFYPGPVGGIARFFKAIDIFDYKSDIEPVYTSVLYSFI